MPHLLHQLATWQLAPGKLEMALADITACRQSPQQLLVAVPHLLAWLHDRGITIAEGAGALWARWLPTLGIWGQLWGKIERFFGTVRSQFLTEVEAAGVATLAELNSAFQAWVEVIYHQAVHSETEEKPLLRFQASIVKTGVRHADTIQLRQAFLWREKRTVTRTATLSLQGNRYGVDPLLAGQPVELRFDPFDLSELEVWSFRWKETIHRPCHSAEDGKR